MPDTEQNDNDWTDHDAVICRNCGFLAILQRIPLRTLVEADRETRKSGSIPQGVANVLGYHAWPICFVLQKQLPDEFEAAVKTRKPDSDPAFLQVITTDRKDDCKNAFTKWNQGFSPKEHYEMLQEKDRLAWQEKREQESRDFQAAQAKLADDRHKENLAAVIAGSKGNVWSNMIGAAIGAIATIIGGLLGYLLHKP